MSDLDRSFLGASDAQLRAAAIALAEQQTGVSNRRTVGVWRGLVETMALLLGRLYRALLNPMLDQLDRRTAAGGWLQVHAATVGLRQLAALPAQGNFTATVTAAATLPAGTEVQAAEAGPAFRVTAEVDLQPGSAQVPVEALQPGTAGNLLPGTALGVSALTALSALTAADGWLTRPGRDAETDSQLRARTAAAWDALIEGNTLGRYARAALQVPAITRAAAVRTPRGYGSADVVVATAAGPPTDAQLIAVRSALDGHALLCRDLIVRAPDQVAVEVTISYAGGPPDAPAILRRWLRRLDLGATLRPGDLYSLPWAGHAEPFARLEVLAPTREIDLGDTEIFAPRVTVVGAQGAPIDAAAAILYGRLAADRQTVAGNSFTAGPVQGRWYLEWPPGAADSAHLYVRMPPSLPRLLSVTRLRRDVTSDWERHGTFYVYRPVRAPATVDGFIFTPGA